MKTNELLRLAKNVIRNESKWVNHAGKMLDEEFIKAVELIYNSKGHIVITGMGKSGDIGKKIAATFSSIGIFSYYLHPSEALHGDLGKLRSGDVIIAISHSGETEELIVLLNKIDDLKLDYSLITITSKIRCSLAKKANAKILTYVKKEVRKKRNEYFLTPTASTTVTLALGDAMACVLQEMTEFQPHNFRYFHPGGNLGAKLCKECPPTSTS